MYLFNGQEQMEIPIKCKLCLNEIKFTVTAEEYKQVTKFPIKKESVHGDPEHILTVFINKNLEIENFKIKQLGEEESAVISQEITESVLKDLGLDDVEIKLYFLTIGRDAVSLGEMALLINKSKEECKQIAEKFMDKGLFKEIVGATPHYSALPPYAALLDQLRDFHDYISKIKNDLPSQVDKSFSEFQTQTGDDTSLAQTGEMIQTLKEKMLTELKTQKESVSPSPSMHDQIQGLSADVEELEDYAKTVMQSQVDEIKKQFENVNTKTSQIIQAQVDDLKDQIENMKSTISNNLQKLRLGVIQQTVDQLVDKVTSNAMEEISDGLNVQLSVNEMVFAEELQKTTEKLNTEFIEKFKDSIEGTIGNLNGIPIKTEMDQKEIIKDLGKQFDEAVEKAEKEIKGISGGIFKNLGNIKEMFKSQVVSTIQRTLGDITDRLKIQELMTKEFWDQAKKRSTMTMKDIWFIRSPEAAKAHIDDELSKAKLRILIVAPQITDLNLETIKNSPRHVNIRIATSIDVSNPQHQSILNELDPMDNVSYRNRSLQNLWGINRDYEEVVLCVLSKTEYKGKFYTEIAGIGSIIEEHIKIFVPILEDAWVGAQKEIAYTVENSSTIQPEVTPQKEVIEEPSPRLKEKKQEKEEPIEIRATEKPKLEPRVHRPKIYEKKEQMEEPLVEEPIQEPTKPEAEGEESELLKHYNYIQTNLDILTGTQISKELEDFHNQFIKERGYTSTIRNIHQKSISLNEKTEHLTEDQIKELSNIMDHWKKGLKL